MSSVDTAERGETRTVPRGGQHAAENRQCTREGVRALGGVDGPLSRPGMALTPAGKTKRVLYPDALLLLGFGPRLPQAVRELAQGFGTLA